MTDHRLGPISCKVVVEFRVQADTPESAQEGVLSLIGMEPDATSLWVGQIHTNYGLRFESSTPTINIGVSR